jgi:predicted nucleic acid-binding protein
VTAVKVVDASVVAAILFSEPGAQGLGDSLDGSSLIGPSLLDFELTNVCLQKIRRNKGHAEKFKKAFAERRGLSIKMMDVDFDGVLALADQQGLTAYDASYLWLAREHGAELVTLDKRLGAAASRLHRGS